MPDAGPQDEWASNRRRQNGARSQWHRVALDGAGCVIAYVAAENAPDEPGSRLFLVAEPAQRSEIGLQLLPLAMAAARAFGSASTWFVEYASDEEFREYLTQHGFNEVRRFSHAGAGELVVLSTPLRD